MNHLQHNFRRTIPKLWSMIGFWRRHPVQRTTNQPFHTYQKAGYYNVNLKVTTIVANGTGCVNEVKMDSMIHVAPIPTVGFTPILKGYVLMQVITRFHIPGAAIIWISIYGIYRHLTAERLCKIPIKPRDHLSLTCKSATGNYRIESNFQIWLPYADSTVLVKRKPLFSLRLRRSM